MADRVKEVRHNQIAPKARRTNITKTRALRARRKAGIASTLKRLGHQAKAVPSRSIRNQVIHRRRHTKRPPFRSRR